jgi:hypothetical protein
MHGIQTLSTSYFHGREAVIITVRYDTRKPAQHSIEFMIVLSRHIQVFLTSILLLRIQRRLKMSLWVDKYRPSKLDHLDYHTEQAAQLKRLV